MRYWKGKTLESHFTVGHMTQVYTSVCSCAYLCWKCC